MATNFDIGIFIVTDRHTLKRQIGNGGQSLRQFSIGHALGFFGFLQIIFQTGNFIHQALRFGVIALPFGLADFLGGLIAARLQVLRFSNGSAALIVQHQHVSRA